MRIYKAHKKQYNKKKQKIAQSRLKFSKIAEKPKMV